uniref:Uncharacterized protein n=1 Tax=Arundo donax TaxID=35708 RepID=A0A0A9HFW4_ARUDO
MLFSILVGLSISSFTRFSLVGLAWPRNMRKEGMVLYKLCRHGNIV